MDKLQIFNYQTKEVRTILKDGEPWFAATDVCEILNLGNTTMAISRLSDSMKGLNSIDTLGGRQYMHIISEAGLYKLVFTSRKPEAEKFTDWVASEVIPSIRKHGMYAKDELLDNPDLLIEVATKLKEERALRLTAENKVKELAPKADFFDAVAGSKDTIDIGQAAKVLNYGKGRNTLFKILRAEGILDRSNIPYQEYIDRGYFRIIEQKFALPDGSTRINIKTLVYQRGLDYIRKILEKQKSA